MISFEYSSPIDMRLHGLHALKLHLSLNSSLSTMEAASRQHFLWKHFSLTNHSFHNLFSNSSPSKGLFYHPKALKPAALSHWSSVEPSCFGTLIDKNSCFFFAPTILQK